MIQREPQLPSAGSLRPEAFAGRLELREVSFSYPTRPGTRVLNAISLKVNPGQVRGRRVPDGWEKAWAACVQQQCRAVSAVSAAGNGLDNEVPCLMLAGHPSAQHLWALPGMRSSLNSRMQNSVLKGCPWFCHTNPAGGGAGWPLRRRQDEHCEAGAALLHARRRRGAAGRPRCRRVRSALAQAPRRARRAGEREACFGPLRVPMGGGCHQSMKLCL